MLSKILDSSLQRQGSRRNDVYFLDHHVILNHNKLRASHDDAGIRSTIYDPRPTLFNQLTTHPVKILQRLQHIRRALLRDSLQVDLRFEQVCFLLCQLK